MSTFGRALLVIVPLALIGAGLWAIYPPAALVAVGGLVWFDLRSSGGPE